MYCSWPYTQYFIDEDGTVTTCCPNWTSINLGNVLNTHPMEIWRGERATLLRQSIVDQSFRYCVRCQNPEALIEPSFPDPPPNLDLIERLLLSYDPTCNLRCQSCRKEPRRPHELAKQIHEVVLSSGILKHTLILNLSGDGEALVSPLYWPMLTSKLDCHPDMTIDLKSNGLLLTPERLKSITDSGKKFRYIGISVDAATRETYALNRGGDWDLLTHNLDKLNDLPYPRGFNFVVQTNNFREMKKFVEMALRYHTVCIYFSGLLNWGTYADQDYLSRAVHLPGHPLYGELKELLTDPIFQRPEIYLASLPSFRPGHAHDHRTTDPLETKNA